ncbi:MAG: 3' terminal RNA ribose 2'-O-methyltransferase Hen1 [Oscillospiraceae bacterium]|nr:3' terminal RNA ribose 2'-O-methyltransferase Hen1 [Oscillospiraceae bacterium]
MLLTITYTGQNTTELGYLLYKNPYRPQVFALNHGKAYVFYPEASNERTTAALLLDIDPIDLARGKAGAASGGLFDYVNDRPYVSSSFLSTAISKVFGTAMTGRADAHQELSDSPLDLTASVVMLPCRGEREKINSVFEPLGYEVKLETFVSDEKFPDWGESEYVNLTVGGRVRLRDLLKHLYVLIPVFDRQKHYWVGADEVEKLLRIGEDWLPDHPEKAYITARYLNRRRFLVNMAFERLAAADSADGEAPSAELKESEDKLQKTPSLNTQRLGSVIAALKGRGVKRVIDIGCGEGNLLNLLVKDSQFTNIAGVDVSHIALSRAREKLKLDRAGDFARERTVLFQGSLTYRDSRFSGYDAACVIEVIEHLDISRLAAFERVLFEFAKPPVVVLTTPNREYNANYGFSREDDLRHGDHRFEWTREQFRNWANRTAERFGYTAQFSEIGDADETRGAPTQMGVFTICR